jgi:hypothetical protein
MPDVAVVMLIVVCFLVALTYANLCDRLLALPATKDVFA